MYRKTYEGSVINGLRILEEVDAKEVDVHIPHYEQQKHQNRRFLVESVDGSGVPQRVMTLGAIKNHLLPDLTSEKYTRRIGEQIGDWTIVEPVIHVSEKSNRRLVKWRATNSEGKSVVGSIHDLASLNPRGELKGPRVSHGAKAKDASLSDRKLYMNWVHLRRRLTLPHIKGFESWGGAGFVMCDEWLEDYGAFRECVINECGVSPGPRYLLVPIAGKEFRPGNIRWVKRTWVDAYVDSEEFKDSQ